MPKSMPVFFIDNQASFGKGAMLVGDMVVWPDPGKYPTFVPVCVATHPDFDGRVVMMAGNRGLVMAFVNGAKNVADIQRALSSGNGVDQYRIALDSLVHRMVLHRAGDVGQDDRVGAVPLLATLARSCPKEAGMIQQAIRGHLSTGKMPPEVWNELEELLQVMEAAIENTEPSHG